MCNTRDNDRNINRSTKENYTKSNINCILIIAGADPGENMICWRKIVIFHTKYPKHLQVRPPPNLKSWIRPCIGMSCLTLCILCRYEDKSMKNNSFSETVEHVKHISVRHVSHVVGLILIFFYV